VGAPRRPAVNLLLPIPPDTVEPMPSTFDCGFAPDPEDPVDVLAFVLCPARVFAPAGDAGELEAIDELMTRLRVPGTTSRIAT